MSKGIIIVGLSEGADAGTLECGEVQQRVHWDVIWYDHLPSSPDPSNPCLKKSLSICSRRPLIDPHSSDTYLDNTIVGWSGCISGCEEV